MSSFRFEQKPKKIGDRHSSTLVPCLDDGLSHNDLEFDAERQRTAFRNGIR